MEYSAIRSALAALLGSDCVLFDESSLTEYGRDRTREHRPQPSVVVFPRRTEEVQEIVRWCYRSGVAMVASGGRTGYAGAAVATQGEVVVSVARMNEISPLDVQSASIGMQAGAILENVQKTVAQGGMYFPLDFAARGSAQIGGCISTNAGGIKVLKYGMTRELVLGLQAVIADGQLLDLNSNLHKNNSGYDLKQFFIGSEGTLGIITNAIMKVVSPPARLRTALISMSSFPKILDILSHARLRGMDVTAFEFFTDACLDAVLAHKAASRKPFQTPSPYYVLIEIDEGRQEGELEVFVESVADAVEIDDATIASGSQSERLLWSYRESISESISMLGNVHKNDIALPIPRMPIFMDDLETMIRSRYGSFETLIFGHIGDGNLHINVVDRHAMDPVDFIRITDELDVFMCDLVKKHAGSISAEHGIGLLKKKLLHRYRPPLDIALMKTIKRSLDPSNLFNPGKIIDA